MAPLGLSLGRHAALDVMVGPTELESVTSCVSRLLSLDCKTPTTDIDALPRVGASGIVRQNHEVCDALSFKGSPSSPIPHPDLTTWSDDVI